MQHELPNGTATTKQVTIDLCGPVKVAVGAKEHTIGLGAIAAAGEVVKISVCPTILCRCEFEGLSKTLVPPTECANSINVARRIQNY
jgi:hypothetical protein